MKFLSFILAIIVITLNMQSCSDGLNSEDSHIVDIQHNHSEDTDDLCSPFCFCNCCGIAVIVQDFNFYDFTSYRQIIHSKQNFFFQSIYRIDNFFNIWHPPKI